MKYLIKSFHIETLYMKVNSADTNFYKGFGIGFNKDETKLKYIHAEMWIDFKSCGYLLKEVTKKEFDEAYKKALNLLKELKND